MQLIIKLVINKVFPVEKTIAYEFPCWWWTYIETKGTTGQPWWWSWLWWI